MTRYWWILALVLVCAGCGEGEVPQESMEYQPGDQFLDLSNAPEETESGWDLILADIPSFEEMRQTQIDEAMEDGYLLMECSDEDGEEVFAILPNGDVRIRGEIVGGDERLWDFLTGAFGFPLVGEETTQ